MGSETTWPLELKHQAWVAASCRPKYVPGWDCHGLPIELKVLQSMRDEQRAALTPNALRRKARDFAIKTMKAQREQFKRWVYQRTTVHFRGLYVVYA